MAERLSIAYDLRPAGVGDRVFLYELQKQAMGPYIVAIQGFWDDGLQGKDFEQHWNSEQTRVVSVEGEDVGRLDVVDQRQAVYLAEVQLLPGYQRKGIGRALVERVIREAGKKPVVLRCLKVNHDAMRFYGDMGFAITEVTETAYFMKRPPEFPNGKPSTGGLPSSL